MEHLPPRWGERLLACIPGVSLRSTPGYFLETLRVTEAFFFAFFARDFLLSPDSFLAHFEVGGVAVFAAGVHALDAHGFEDVAALFNVLNVAHGEAADEFAAAVAFRLQKPAGGLDPEAHHVILGFGFSGGDGADDPAGARHEDLFFGLDDGVVPVEEFQGEVFVADVRAAHEGVEFCSSDFFGSAAAGGALKAGGFFAEVQDEGFGLVGELVGDGVAAQVEAEGDHDFFLAGGHAEFAFEVALLGGLVGAHQGEKFAGGGGRLGGVGSRRQGEEEQEGRDS